MNTSAPLLHCPGCSDLLPWNGEERTKIRCRCGVSGGVRLQVHVENDGPPLEVLQLFGDALLVRPPADEKGELIMVSSDSYNVKLVRYEDEAEFDARVAFPPASDSGPVIDEEFAEAMAAKQSPLNYSN